MYVMEKYDLTSDPCDYRLIRINNCLQLLACICNVLALINDSFSALANLINRIADIFYHCITGCMTAQVILKHIAIHDIFSLVRVIIRASYYLCELLGCS